MNRNTDVSSSNTIKFKCLLVLVVLAVLSIAILFIHQLYIKNEETTAAVVNVSGRQRMLSQLTAHISLRLVYSKNMEEREKLRADL
ncbi:MAG: diguanylate cyclase domain-containing protein, partial [Planctomycetota bacterium]